ncbi:type 4a pilus biogenesis protein PilO [Candidatus Woesebacteria bacterium]|nr:type 4a pilus biogenesis protein PilO [Candidatus Woesebacteria bacterium]
MANSSFLTGASSINTKAILASARKRRFFTISIISWLTIAVLAVVVLLPAVQSILTSMSELTTKQDELTTLRTQVDALSSVDETLERQRIAILQAALPAEKPVLPLLYSLDKLAIQSQVGISNFQVSPGELSSLTKEGARTESTLAPGVFSLPLQMQVTGTFMNLNSFFKQLDTIVPLVRITTIEFEGADASALQSATASESAMYQANVTMESLFVSISPSTSGTIESSLRPEHVELLERLTAAYSERQTDVALQSVAISTGSATRNIFSQ